MTAFFALMRLAIQSCRRSWPMARLASASGIGAALVVLRDQVVAAILE